MPHPNDLPTSETQTSERHMLSRRQLLEVAATSLGAVAGIRMLPTHWVKPAIEVRYLPVHAQVSSLSTSTPTPTSTSTPTPTPTSTPTPTPTAQPRCAANLAGRLATDASGRFQWYEFFGAHSFNAADSMVLSFGIIPFNLEDSYIALDEIDGRTGYALTFSNGLVNGSVPYLPNAWNCVEAEFDFSTSQYRISVNGSTSGPLPFNYADSNSVQALRVHHFPSANSQAIGWLDSIRIVHIATAGSADLFEANFDDGTVYVCVPGTITALPLP
ncbi:hypothetical protein TFLX_00438 [Thermoflexales bacterium]|nr:hypothetical protein TFLX_00438 [Thermoflexales bacterium]